MLSKAETYPYNHLSQRNNVSAASFYLSCNLSFSFLMRLSTVQRMVLVIDNAIVGVAVKISEKGTLILPVKPRVPSRANKEKLCTKTKEKLKNWKECRSPVSNLQIGCRNIYIKESLIYGSVK